MDDRPTYGELFALLDDLGFRSEAADRFERVFLRERTDTVLLFALLDDPSTDRAVTEADFISAETHLRGRGLIDAPLRQVVESHSNDRAR